MGKNEFIQLKIIDIILQQKDVGGLYQIKTLFQWKLPTERHSVKNSSR